MRKPKIVEFMGLPNAGKTKHIDVLERTLRQMKESGLDLTVGCIPDQIRNVPPSIQDELEKNRWALRKLGNLIAEAKQGDRDLIVVDRGAWAYFASVQTLIKDGRYIRSRRKLRKAHRTLGLARDIALEEDFFILIKISPEKSLQIDQEFATGRVGKIVNQPFLSIMEEEYRNIRGRLPPWKMRMINGKKNFQENQEKLLKITISLKEDILQNSQNGKKGGGQWKEIVKETKMVKKAEKTVYV